MPYWLEDDAFHEWPVWDFLAGGNADLIDRFQSAYSRLKSLAALTKKDGYLSSEGALRQCRGRRQILDKLCTPVLDEPPLVHRPGDDCACLGDKPWIQGFGYRIHAFLKRNPSKKEYDRNKEQKADLNDARLKSQVFNRDGGCCRYCGSGPLSAKAGRARDRRRVLHFDHVDPDQPAGPDAVNLVTACARCNEFKGRRTPDEADMVLLPVPTPEQAEAMRRRPRQLYDPLDARAPMTVASPAEQPRTSAGSASAPEQPPDQPPEQPTTVDPIVDPTVDPPCDPNADHAAAARPLTGDQTADQPPATSREGSGSGRVGQPDLVPPERDQLGQPERSPAYPDPYTRRSRAASAEVAPAPWPPARQPLDQGEGQHHPPGMPAPRPPSEMS